MSPSSPLTPEGVNARLEVCAREAFMREFEGESGLGVMKGVLNHWGIHAVTAERMTRRLKVPFGGMDTASCPVLLWNRHVWGFFARQWTPLEAAIECLDRNFAGLGLDPDSGWRLVFDSRALQPLSDTPVKAIAGLLEASLERQGLDTTLPSAPMACPGRLRL
jgi:hypothetical protein